MRSKWIEKRDAGNRTPSHKNVEAKSDIKDPEKYAAWEIHYRQGWKETNGKKEIEEKVRKAKKKLQIRQALLKIAF